MERMLEDIPPLIVGYLPPTDAINLSRTCKALNSQLSLTVTRRRILTSFHRHNRNGIHHYCFQIPVASQVPVHSIIVSMNLGWTQFLGGRAFVVAQEEKQQSNNKLDFVQSGTGVVCSSEMEPYKTDRLSLTFKPRETESYHLWYIVRKALRRRRGHDLQLSDVSVQALAFDDEVRSFRKAHTFLASSDTIHPWDVTTDHRFHHDTSRAILASARYAFAHGLHVLPTTASIFGCYGISRADLSMELIKSIKSTWVAWEQEMFAYANSQKRNGQGEQGDEDDFTVIRGHLIAYEESP